MLRCAGSRFIECSAAKAEELSRTTPMKAEIRKPKSERNPKPEGRNLEPRDGSRLRNSRFGLPSDFGFRISNFKLITHSFAAATSMTAVHTNYRNFPSPS